MALNTAIDGSRTNFKVKLRRPIGPNLSASDFPRGTLAVGLPTTPEESARIAERTDLARFALGFSLNRASQISYLPIRVSRIGSGVNPVLNLGSKVPVNLALVSVRNITADVQIPPAADLDDLGAAAEDTYVRAVPGSDTAIQIKDSDGSFDTNEYDILYQWAPTVDHMRTLLREPPLLQDGPSHVRFVEFGWGDGSEVYTLNYTVSAGALAVQSRVQMGDDGKIEYLSGAAADYSIGYVIKTPTQDDPYLGIRLAVGQ